MKNGRLLIARIAGIPITLDYSWFLIFGLIVWSLSGGYFRALLPDLPRMTHWALAVLAALALFLSVLLHELAHSLVARARGMKIRGITLHVFGGIAQLGSEPATPKAEFWMAVVGPLTSFALALVFGVLSALTSLDGGAVTAGVVLRYLTYINLMLALFNTVPAFPLDGGRVLRAILWHRWGSLQRSTRWASRIGTGFAYFLMILGFWSLLAGAFFGGLWFILIGMFLKQGSQSSYQMVVLRRALRNMTVADLMTRDPVTVPGQLSLQEAVDQVFERSRHGCHPVVADGAPAGLICLKQLKDTPREDWAQTSVASVMEPLSPDNTVTADADLGDAFGKLVEAPSGRLLVLGPTRSLQGILSVRDVLRVASLRSDLSLSPGA